MAWYKPGGWYFASKTDAMQKGGLDVTIPFFTIKKAQKFRFFYLATHMSVEFILESVMKDYEIARIFLFLMKMMYIYKQNLL